MIKLQAKIATIMENPGSCLAFETTTERLLADAKEQEGAAITGRSCPPAAGSWSRPCGRGAPGGGRGGKRVGPAGRWKEGRWVCFSLETWSFLLQPQGPGLDPAPQSFVAPTAPLGPLCLRGTRGHSPGHAGSLSPCLRCLLGLQAPAPTPRAVSGSRSP